MSNYSLYHDIKERTDGEIYLGVVGPVRCGKSTFIKRFMDLLVLPSILDPHKKERTNDELPQSSAGRTIMTTEPKFIPKDAALINLDDETQVKIRLIDCVGYMTNGAVGHIEDDKERMVKTPWFDYDIPFTQAATLGTRKVIEEHSTIGLVVTADGSFGEFERDDYLEAEEKTIRELLTLGKPFVVILNSAKPYSDTTLAIADEISEKYGVTVIPVNCTQLKSEDIKNILEKCLYEFPVTNIRFYISKWIEMLENSHWLKQSIIECLKSGIKKLKRMSIINDSDLFSDCEYITNIKIAKKDYSTGTADVYITVDNQYYYDILTELSGVNITSEFDLINNLKEMAELRDSYTKIQDAFNMVQAKGYGVVMPDRNEISLNEPEVIKNGTKYGVKIKAQAPSIHMIKANILTEIAPIVGSEDQAKDLITFIKENENSGENGIWDTNIFGKTIEQIVSDGIRNKVEKLSDETQEKMQDTIEKITNDSKGGVICIII